MIVLVVPGLLVLFVAGIWWALWAEAKPLRVHKRKLFVRGRIKKYDEWEK